MGWTGFGRSPMGHRHSPSSSRCSWLGVVTACLVVLVPVISANGCAIRPEAVPRLQTTSSTLMLPATSELLPTSSTDVIDLRQLSQKFDILEAGASQALEAAWLVDGAILISLGQDGDYFMIMDEAVSKLGSAIDDMHSVLSYWSESPEFGEIAMESINSALDRVHGLMGVQQEMGALRELDAGIKLVGSLTAVRDELNETGEYVLGQAERLRPQLLSP